ncbi:MAG: alpha/beta fold hydrolase [Betaproteobacteria bacterium]|jgi:magnesium chelatase accessory protein|nr:alpha/beta fold hydrolase [Betaproteobacteria bacterium]
MSPPPRPSNIEDFEHHLDGLHWHGWHRPRLGGEPMLLLLHGTGADRSSWGPLLDALPLTWGVIAPDLPGHGQTQFDRRQSLGLREMAVLSQRLLKAMGMRHVDMVVGHSAGAAVGLVMALNEREMPCGRLYGLAPSLVPPPAFYTQMLGPLLGPLVLSSPSLLMLGGLARSSLVVDRLLASTGTVLNADRHAHYQRLFAQSSHLRGALAFMAATDLPSLLEEAQGLALPTKLLAARDDPWIPAEPLSRVIDQHLPKAVVDLEWRDVGGHLFHEADPKPVAERLVSWMAT